MKRNFIILIIIILFLTFLGFFSNFYLDSYGVLGKRLEYQTLEPNQNYMKTKYILENPKKFNGFIFGSSRVGNIPTEDIANYEFYNMTCSEGLPQEWEENLKVFIKNKVFPKIIILGIDDFSFKIDSQIHEKELLRKSFSKVNIFKDYILVNPFTKYNFIKLKNIIYSKKNKEFNQDFREHGRLFKKLRVLKEKEIENNSLAHLEKSIFKEKNGYSYLKNTQKNKVVESLNNIVRICEINNIKLIFLFNPIHPNSYIDNKAREEYRKIRSEIKNNFKTIKIYDFAEDEITEENLQWFETSHFNTNVGRMILKRMEELSLKTK